MQLKSYQILIPVFWIALLISCTTPAVISVDVHKPAAIYLPGVQKIAIVDFQGPDGAGGQIATLTQSILLNTGYYEIMEREKLSRIMDEQNLNMAGIVDESTAVEVGRLLGVDALIFGDVTIYRVEQDERGVEKVERKVGTGRYETVEVNQLFSNKKKKVKREIMKTVLVDQHYRIRRGTVAVNFRVVGVETGQLLAAHSDSKSYNSGKVVEGSSQTLKPEGQILSDLSGDVSKQFVNMIAPHFDREKRTIEPGKGNINAGKKYAEAGLWPEAMDAWKQAVQELPEEPAAFYNLGLAYEVRGDFNHAEAAYKKAVSFKQKSLYLDAIARIRRLREEQQELQEQLMDRE